MDRVAHLLWFLKQKMKSWKPVSSSRLECPACRLRLQRRITCYFESQFVCSFLECPAYRPLLRTACYCESLRLTKKVKKNNFFECKFSSTRRTRCFSNSLRLKNPSKKNSFLKDVYHFWTNVSTINIFCNSFRMTNMSFGMNYISLLLYMRTMKN